MPHHQTELSEATKGEEQAANGGTSASVAEAEEQSTVEQHADSEEPPLQPVNGADSNSAQDTIHQSSQTAAPAGDNESALPHQADACMPQAAGAAIAATAQQDGNESAATALEHLPPRLAALLAEGRKMIEDARLSATAPGASAAPSTKPASTAAGSALGSTPGDVAGGSHVTAINMQSGAGAGAQTEAWRVASSIAGVTQTGSLMAAASADDEVQSVVIDDSSPLRPLHPANAASRPGSAATTANRASSAAGHVPSRAGQQTEALGVGSTSAASDNKYLQRLKWPPISSVVQERTWLHDALSDTLDISACSSGTVPRGAQASCAATSTVNKPQNSLARQHAAARHNNERTTGGQSTASGLWSLDSVRDSRKLGGLAFGEESKENVASPSKPSWGFGANDGSSSGATLQANMDVLSAVLQVGCCALACNLHSLTEI